MDHQLTASGNPILLRQASSAHGAIGMAERPHAADERHAEQLSARFVRSIIKAREIRRQFFDDGLFSDPAWDMLLELYALKCEGRRVSVSKLSVAAGVPGTTALRWIDKLEQDRLIVRIDDPLDGRRVWVTISEPGFALMREYLEQIPMRQATI